MKDKNIIYLVIGLVVAFFLLSGRTNFFLFSTLVLTGPYITVSEDEIIEPANVFGGEATISGCVDDECVAASEGGVSSTELLINGIKVATVSLGSCDFPQEPQTVQFNLNGVTLNDVSELRNGSCVRNPSYSITYFERVECTKDVHCIDYIQLKAGVCNLETYTCEQYPVVGGLPTVEKETVVTEYVEGEEEPTEGVEKKNTLIWLLIIGGIALGLYLRFKKKNEK